jgi:hypothetical protein
MKTLTDTFVRIGNNFITPSVVCPRDCHLVSTFCGNGLAVWPFILITSQIWARDILHWVIVEDFPNITRDSISTTLIYAVN